MLHAVRVVFALVCGVLGWVIGIDLYQVPWMGLFVGLGAGLFLVVIEIMATRRLASLVLTLVLGILVGCLLSHFVIQVLDLLSPDLAGRTRMYRNFALSVVLSFLSVLIILHLKDDFKFAIPFVELRREGTPGPRALLLDTSAIIDGRIADLVETRILGGTLVVPRFVLAELQQVADSADKVKRNRGRRGLDVLARLRQCPSAEVRVEDVELPGVEGVDAKLVRLARLLDARIVTTDFNLNKVAQVQGLEVINVNDVARALRPPVLQGERVSVKILRTGESPGQGVGYLEDGTMVVAEECAGKVGQQVDLVVTNVLQTSAGRLIFARPA
jgi:uncharacterized protein YacL